MLEFFLDCYKVQQMRNKSVDTFPSAIKFVHECYKTQKVFDKAIILVLLYFILFTINVKLEKCVVKVFPENLLC